MRSTVVILGCGYTGTRVARLLLEQGVTVIATSPRPEGLEELARRGAIIRKLDVLEPATVTSALQGLPAGVRVVHSIPVIEGPAGWLEPTPLLLEALGERPVRIVYLSTTGVYGSATKVDETTAANPDEPREQLRLAAERAVAGAGCSWLVLRCPAIYGPGRGVHRAVLEGRFRLAGDGSNYVSRIHVDDLAAHVVAGLWSEVTGAYPVGDDAPCTSREIALFCAKLFGLPAPSAADPSQLHYTRRRNRQVDGRAIRRLLGIELRYPSYREGILAALAEEGWAPT